MVSRGAAPPPAPPAPASRRLGFGLTRGLARQGGGQQVSPRLGGGGRPERGEGARRSGGGGCRAPSGRAEGRGAEGRGGGARGCSLRGAAGPGGSGWGRLELIGVPDVCRTCS